MNFYIYTLGCKVNKYESQVMHEALVSAGYIPAENAESADITIVNSCTVTSVSDSKAMKLLRKIKRENSKTILVLTGCLPQAFPDEKDKFSVADIVLGNKCRADLLPSLEAFKRSKEKIYNISPHKSDISFEKMTVNKFNERTRAFVKIEDGCNRFCSYCIIPYARGRVRSKPVDELKAELTSLAANGYKEVVLVGINLSAYGAEFNINLADAIEAACSIDGIERVRLGSLEPERMDNETIKRLAKQKKLCPQFHLSLQSGCDETLKRMNRHYNSKEYMQIVENLRNAFDNASITTDVMVGFPGETQEEFESSYEFVKNVGFARVHVFAYSRRPGTAADKAENQIDSHTKDIRSKQMIKMTEQSKNDFLLSQIGKTEEVLFETRKQSGICVGYTKNYTPVFVKADDDLCGNVKKVRLVNVIGDKCEGIIAG